MSAESDEGETEEVIDIEGLAIIGSRLQARSVEDSALPIDILGSDEFIKQGGTDLRYLMRNVVPSYYVNNDWRSKCPECQTGQCHFFRT